MGFLMIGPVEYRGLNNHQYYVWGFLMIIVIEHRGLNNYQDYVGVPYDNHGRI